MTINALLAKITLPKLAFGSILLFIDFIMKPSLSLIGLVIFFIVLDFVTGVIKSKLAGIARTSEGYRRTVMKISQYMVPILLFWGMSLLPEMKKTPYAMRFEQASGWVMLFVIYIELTSVFENLYEIDNQSIIGKTLYKYALIILKFGIENNAVKKVADKLEQENKSNEP